MKVKVKDEKNWDLRHSAEIVRLYIRDFFRIIATQQHTFIQDDTNTHTCTHIHSEIQA